MDTISPQNLRQRLSDHEQIAVIDVRSPGEYQSGHIKEAMNIPLECVDAAALQTFKESGQIVFVCRSGARATTACDRVLGQGLVNASVLEGGTQGWIHAGYPVSQAAGKQMMSIERQVRIGAGLLVLCGVLLGFTISSNWFFLSGFVGMGLTFAGITDWCGMGLLLAMMPWNKPQKTCCKMETGQCQKSS